MKVHHLGAALQFIADEHADVLTPRQIEALYRAAAKLWDGPSGDQHDSHVLLAQKLFRDVGFTLHAMQFKRSPAALAALRKFNRVPADWQHPFAWNYHPNEWCRDNWRSYLPCAHDYHRVGHVGMCIVYECSWCGDEYEKDVS
jgi:hypothetical protein